MSSWISPSFCLSDRPLGSLVGASVYVRTNLLQCPFLYSPPLPPRDDNASGPFCLSCCCLSVCLFFLLFCLFSLFSSPFNYCLSSRVVQWQKWAKSLCYLQQTSCITSLPLPLYVCVFPIFLFPPLEQTYNGRIGQNLPVIYSKPLHCFPPSSCLRVFPLFLSPFHYF